MEHRWKEGGYKIRLSKHQTSVESSPSARLKVERVKGRRRHGYLDQNRYKEAGEGDV